MRTSDSSKTSVPLPPFQNLSQVIARVRQGDNDAATTLVGYYEPLLRELVSDWLRQPQRGVLSTNDVLQSVWGRVLVNSDVNEANLNDPGTLLSFLIMMARQKIQECLMNHADGFPSVNRLGTNLRATTHEPHRIVAGSDLLAKVRAEFPDDLRGYFDLWLAGVPWRTVAEGTGRKYDTIRKDVARRLKLIGQTIDLY